MGFVVVVVLKKRITPTTVPHYRSLAQLTTISHAFFEILTQKAHCFSTSLHTLTQLSSAMLSLSMFLTTPHCFLPVTEGVVRHLLGPASYHSEVCSRPTYTVAKAKIKPNDASSNDRVLKLW